MKKLIGLCRVSSVSQEDNQSLALQRKQIYLYCQLHNKEYEVVDIISEVCSNTTVTTRAIFQSVLNRMTDFDGIIVANLDRFSRSLKDIGVIEHELLRANGKGLIAIDDNINTFGDDGQFMLVENNKKKFVASTITNLKRLGKALQKIANFLNALSILDFFV